MCSGQHDEWWGKKKREANIFLTLVACFICDIQKKNPEALNISLILTFWQESDKEKKVVYNQLCEGIYLFK